MIRDYAQLVDTICFNICIDAWGKQGHPEKAEAVLRRLHQYHHRRSEFESDHKNEDEDEDDASLRRRNSMTTLVVRPNQISFNSAINAWSKSASLGGNSGGNDDYPQKAADRAGGLWQQMKAQGLEPTQETFGSLMEAYSKTPNPGVRVQSFLDELEKMYSEGEISLPPPKVCYLMAIRAWGRTKPGGAKKAESLLQRLEETCLKEGGDWAEMEPCAILYTALISAWAESDAESAPDRAWELFREMDRKAKLPGRTNVVSPNAITLNAVLRAFCNHDRIDEARKLLLARTRTRTKQHAVRPDSKSYLTVLKAYANSNASDAADKAQEFLRELEDNYRRGEDGTTTKPTVRMYSQLLVAWGNSPKSDAAFRAEKLFWQLLRQEDNNDDDDDDNDDDDSIGIGVGIGVLPDTATFNCVLRAWSKSFEGGAAERAESFLQKVQEEHSHSGEISIDPISHLHLIYAWAHSRRRKAPREAEKHLEQARTLCRQSGKQLTRAHFNGTILAWKKSNDRNAARHIQKLQDERDSRTQP
jgi:pentatricopeptide repeat protein